MEKYPSLLELSKCPDIFSVKQVVATEKLHGSNFRLYFPLGMKSIDEIEYGTRDTEYGKCEKFVLGSTLLKFKAQTNLLTRMMEVFQSYDFNDVTVFGEAYGPGIKSKGVKYSNGQEPLFRAFDFMVHQNFVTYDLFCEIADKMDLPRVHEVWRGEPTQANLDALLEKPSTEGLLNGFGEDNIAEGVVIRSNPLLRDVFGEWLICKHKSTKFAEVAMAPKDKTPRGPTVTDDFALMYVTEGRIYNAIGRLVDRGQELSDTMKDMPVLLTEMLADLEKECKTDWEAQNGELDLKVLKGAVSRVLGPLYREVLSKNS